MKKRIGLFAVPLVLLLVAASYHDGVKQIVAALGTLTDGNLVSFSGTNGRVEDSSIAKTNVLTMTTASATYATGTPVYVEDDPTIAAGTALPAMDANALTNLNVSTSDYLALADGTGGTNVYNIAFGKYAYADGYSVSLGGKGTSTAFSVSIGYGAIGGSYGNAIGYGANAEDHGVAISTTADGNNYGVAVGHDATGSGTNIAIGVSAVAAGQNRVSIGTGTSNEYDNTTAVRGSMYLDGGTGVMYRATFGSGAWTALGGAGGGSGGSPAIKYVNPADYWYTATNGPTTNVAAGVVAHSNGWAVYSSENDDYQTMYLYADVPIQSISQVVFSTWSSGQATGSNYLNITMLDTAGNSYTTNNVTATGPVWTDVTISEGNLPTNWVNLASDKWITIRVGAYTYRTNSIGFPRGKLYQK